MKKNIFIITLLFAKSICFGQNFGTMLPDFLGVGTLTPTTGFTGFAVKKNINNYLGMYIDAGATGKPFYGYALDGVPKAYTQFNQASSKFEYHRNSDAIADFQIGATDVSFPSTTFLGIGTTTPTTGFTGLSLKSPNNSFWGMYIDAGAIGFPFYGFALNGSAKSYLSFGSGSNSLEYHQTSDVTPDFYVNGNTKAVFNTDFVGIGTSTPTTGFTGLAMKKNVNTFFGSYVDAGATGIPFYGYALNGVPKAYTTYNGSTDQFEYHHTSDAIPDFSVSNTTINFPIQSALNIGTSTALNNFTGLTLKKNSNNFWGMYVDAGVTGKPFYGYALNGIAKAYSQFNGTNNNWELFTNTTAISVDPSGNVGISTSPNGSFRLDVNGNIRCVALTQTSDERYKTNIEHLEGSLEKVNKLDGVSWNWKTQQFPDKQFTDEKQIGFVAQDVEKVIPEVVSTDSQGYKSIDYSKLTAVLAESIKAQQKQIEDQQKQIVYLLEKVNKLGNATKTIKFIE